LGYIAEFVTRKLQLDIAKVKDLWAGTQGAQEKLTYLFEDYILPAGDAPLVLAIDEADSLLQTNFYNDFFWPHPVVAQQRGLRGAVEQTQPGPGHLHRTSPADC